MNTTETIGRKKLLEMDFDLDRLEQAVMKEIWESIAEEKTIDIHKVIERETFIQLHEFTQGLVN